MKKLILIAVAVLSIAVASQAQYVTARQRIADVNAAAATAHSDNALKFVTGFMPGTQPGQFFMWQYIFYSPSTHSETIIGLTGGQISTTPQEDSTYAGAGTLTQFIDSPTPYSNALTNGGSAFLAAHPGSNVFMMAIRDSSNTVAYWVVQFSDQSSQSHMQIYLDLYTGAYIQSVGAPEANPEIASEFQLAQNFPNPFNPSTTISFSLPTEAPVKLTVLDVAGREVAMLVNETRAAGNYAVPFVATNLPSGTYFYRLSVGNKSIVKPMVLTK